MPSNKGPPACVGEQMDYLVTWFREYSELQRDDFLKVLLEKYAPDSPADCLADALNHVGMGDRAPSIFQCRMTLFDEWFGGWSEEERSAFLQRLREEDADFVALLDRAASAAGPQTGEEEEKTVIVVNGRKEEGEFEEEEEVEGDVAGEVEEVVD